MNEGVMLLVRYIAAHVAGFGGLILALGHWMTGHPEMVPADVLISFAGFGLSSPPPADPPLPGPPAVSVVVGTSTTSGPAASPAPPRPSA